jgi:hypothetical protein
LRDVRPEPVRERGVRVGGVVYPVKQAFEVASGAPRVAFTTQTALRHLHALGFEVIGAARPPHFEPPSVAATRIHAEAEAPDSRGWPREGCVQALCAEHLREHGWAIQALADTAAKSRGVDILARRDSRRVGAEVKGWPSETYADAHRRAEAKATRPSTQAGHWFSQALCKAIMLLDSHPGHDSLMVLPDYPRYRDLADRTRAGREAARVHVVFVDRAGGVTSGTWSA